MDKNQNTSFQLLGSLQFMSDEHLELFLQTLDKNSSLYCLVEAVKYCNSRGAFSLGEAELLAKAIRILSKEQQSQKQTQQDGTPDATQ